MFVGHHVSIKVQLDNIYTCFIMQNSGHSENRQVMGLCHAFCAKNKCKLLRYESNLNLWPVSFRGQQKSTWTWPKTEMSQNFLFYVLFLDRRILFKCCPANGRRSVSNFRGIRCLTWMDEISVYVGFLTDSV